MRQRSLPILNQPKQKPEKDLKLSGQDKQLEEEAVADFLLDLKLEDE